MSGLLILVSAISTGIGLYILSLSDKHVGIIGWLLAGVGGVIFFFSGITLMLFLVQEWALLLDFVLEVAY